jgi:hypothetical protein
VQRRWLRTVLRSLFVVLLAAVLWAVGGLYATAPLGMVYGWSGHPPLPPAPTWVWVTLYVVVLPLLSLALAWWVVRGAERLAGRWSAWRAAGGPVPTPPAPPPSEESTR